MTTYDLLPKNNFDRKVIHLDMDAFYASVEQRDHPELKEKALVIARDPRKHHGRGVITTANYVARQYGIGSAMPTMQALEKIPKDLLVFVEPDFDKYRAVSKIIHDVMYEITDIVESVALDEAYLDVTKNKLGNQTTIAVALYLQQQIYQKTNLTSSIGISYNKFLAKMASEYAKPFGRSIILPTEAVDFLKNKDISKFPGIGKKTQTLMRELGINNGEDLQQQDIHFLMNRFKKSGYYYAQHAVGIDLSPVKANRVAKSIGKERTFETAIVDRTVAISYLREFATQISQSLAKKKLNTKTIVIKIRNPDFETITKRRTLIKPTQDSKVIYQESLRLFDEFPEMLDEGIRLLGISTANLTDNEIEEISLFDTRWE